MQSHSGLIAPPHRLGFEYHKPEIIPRRLDEAKPKAFITACEKLLNSLAADAATVVADAAAPTRAIFIPRTTVKGRRGLAPLRSPFHRAARYGTFGSFCPAGAADQIPPHALAEPPRRRSCRSSASAPLPTKRPLSNFPAGPQNLVHFGAVHSARLNCEDFARFSFAPLPCASPWRSRN
ncbi:MAG: hypothetical protein WCC90_00130, partial [Methylocella sp.]